MRPWCQLPPHFLNSKAIRKSLLHDDLDSRGSESENMPAEQEHLLDMIAQDRASTWQLLPQVHCWWQYLKILKCPLIATPRSYIAGGCDSVKKVRWLLLLVCWRFSKWKWNCSKAPRDTFLEGSLNCDTGSAARKGVSMNSSKWRLKRDGCGLGKVHHMQKFSSELAVSPKACCLERALWRWSDKVKAMKAMKHGKRSNPPLGDARKLGFMHILGLREEHACRLHTSLFEQSRR